MGVLAIAGGTGSRTGMVQSSVITIRTMKMQSMARENIVSTENQNNLQYRINLIDLNGRLLLSMNWSSDKHLICYVTDIINEKLKTKFRAQVETKATGYVDVGSGINIRSR